MVIMNITDHLTRVRQQTSATTQRVFGVLYGKQSGLSVEVTTSFELKYAEREGGGIEISKSYLEKNIQLSEWGPDAVGSAHRGGVDCGRSGSCCAGLGRSRGARPSREPCRCPRVDSNRTARLRRRPGRRTSTKRSLMPHLYCAPRCPLPAPSSATLTSCAARCRLRRDPAAKEVFQDHELVGWYATGPGPIAADMLTHRDILAHSDNPVLLKLDSDIAEDQRDLPIAVFESIFAEAADGSRTLVFSPLTYKIQAGEAETVTLEAVANTRPDVENDSVLTHTYAKTAEAMRRLSERVAVLQRFLREVHSGKITPDRHLLRLVSDVVARIPTADSSDFRGALLSDVSDTLLTTLVAAMAKGAAGLSQVLGRLEDGKDAAALSRSRAYGAHAFAGEYGDYDMGMDMDTDA